MDNQPPTNNDLKTKILQRIECGDICLKSRLSFKSREWILWSLWLFTVVVGALAVAVSFFVLLQQTYSLYEVTHSSFERFFIETLPLFWISVFFLMVIFAVYNLNHTKNGYRYPLWQIFGSSLVLSLVGGVLLHLAGTGFILDKQIGLLTAYYESQEKREQKLWQQPGQGRLHGHYISSNQSESKFLVNFQDYESVIWQLNIDELDGEEVSLLHSGSRVKLWGEVTNIEPPHFYTCAVLPVLHEETTTRAALVKLRQKIINKGQRYTSIHGEIALTESPCAQKFSQLQLKFNH